MNPNKPLMDAWDFRVTAFWIFAMVFCGAFWSVFIWALIR